MDKNFVSKNQLSLCLRPFPINCITFDGSSGKDGLVTHFWKGGLSIKDDSSNLFNSDLLLDVTTLGGYDIILGMDWLRLHDGWVGGTSPSLRLEAPSVSQKFVNPGCLIFTSSSRGF